MAIYQWGTAPAASGLELRTVTSAIRTLLWEISPVTPTATSPVTRLYRHDLGPELVVNARWDGSQWVKDVSANASRLRVEAGQALLDFHNGAGTTFSDAAWTGQLALQPNTGALALVNASAELQGPGQTETYAAQQCRTSTTGNTNIGTGCSFRKNFPSTPSSITFTTLDTSGITSGPWTYQTTSYGTGVYCGTSASGNTAYFYTRVIAS